jgi:hypothetical protein
VHGKPAKEAFHQLKRLIPNMNTKNSLGQKMCISFNEPTLGHALSIEDLETLYKLNPNGALFTSINTDCLFRSAKSASETDSADEASQVYLLEPLNSLMLRLPI